MRWTLVPVLAILAAPVAAGEEVPAPVAEAEVAAAGAGCGVELYPNLGVEIELSCILPRCYIAVVTVIPPDVDVHPRCLPPIIRPG